MTLVEVNGGDGALADALRGELESLKTKSLASGLKFEITAW